jgi:hypothetical protein
MNIDRDRVRDLIAGNQTEVPADLAEAVRNIWDVLHAYQDNAIPAYKYREMADDVGPEDPAYQVYDETATAYEAEWDEICTHMAHIIEALGLTQEECS